MMSILSMHPSRSPTPAPCLPYNPTAWTSSTNVRAPYLWATSHISFKGHTSPVQPIKCIHILVSSYQIGYSFRRFKSYFYRIWQIIYQVHVLSYIHTHQYFFQLSFSGSYLYILYRSLLYVFVESVLLFIQIKLLITSIPP